LVINKVTYPYYLEYRDKSQIDKYINADKNTTDEIYDQTFDYIIFSMRKFLNEYFAENSHSGIKEKDNVKKQTTYNDNTSDIDLDSNMSTIDLDDSSDSSDNNDNDEPIELGTFNDPVGEAHFLVD
jgi:hypothetical protein